MKRTVLFCGVLTLVGCAPAQPGTPSVGGTVVSGRVGLPGSFTNGTPFTSSTPFTNSTPAPMSVLATTQAVTLPATQSLQVIDPTSGMIVLERATTAEGRFSVVLPSGLRTAILQVIVRDAKGQIYGLVAMATRPAEPGERLISPGSTVVPLAGALSVAESRTLTYGTGFAGVARPQLSRVLMGLSEATSARAAATFDARLATGGSNNVVMNGVTQTAQSLASYATQGESATPEAIGDRLSIALERTAQGAAPTPAPTPWVGRGPALPVRESQAP